MELAREVKFLSRQPAGFEVDVFVNEIRGVRGTKA